VTLVHRESQLHHHVKYWIKPDLENQLRLKSRLTLAVACGKSVDHVVIVTPDGPFRLMIRAGAHRISSYHDFLRSMGIELSNRYRPVCDPYR
jgi:thioredoxin reductase (NADPH)